MLVELVLVLSKIAQHEYITNHWSTITLHTVQHHLNLVSFWNEPDYWIGNEFYTYYVNYKPNESFKKKPIINDNWTTFQKVCKEFVLKVFLFALFVNNIMWCTFDGIGESNHII